MAQGTAPQTPADAGFHRHRILASLGAAREFFPGDPDARSMRPELLSDIRDLLAQLGWRGLVARAAQDAARVLTPAGVATIDPQLRAAFAADHPAQLEHVARYLAARPDVVIANEAACLLLAGLALLHGDDSDSAPLDTHVALMFMLMNDYAHDFRKPRDRLVRSEAQRLRDMLVAGARSRLFDQRKDVARELTRTTLLFARYGRLAPDAQSLGSAAEWDELQREAFGGMSARDYVIKLAGPLAMITQLWVSHEGQASPIFSPQAVFANFGGAAAPLVDFCESLTIDRDAARDEMRATIDDDEIVPRVTFAYRKPLVRVTETHVACISPSLLVAQLETGMLARLRFAANQRRAEQGGNAVMTVVGKLLEIWTRECFEAAAAARPEVTDWILPYQHDDELSDLVVRTRRNVILFEVKCGTLQERLLKGADDAAELVAWYEKFLFGSGKTPGALRQLDRAVTRIQAGNFESVGIPRDATVFPVVVYLDALNLDHYGAYRWLSLAREHHRVLSRHDVRSPTFMDVATFETLAAWVGVGGDPFALFDRWTLSPMQSEARFELLLRDAVRDTAGGPLRSPTMRVEYERVVRAIHEELLGEPLPADWSLP